MWDPDTLWEGAVLEERDASYKVWGLSAVSKLQNGKLVSSAVFVQKTAELINLPFGLWTRMGRRKRKFNHIHQVAPVCPR